MRQSGAGPENGTPRSAATRYERERDGHGPLFASAVRGTVDRAARFPRSDIRAHGFDRERDVRRVSVLRGLDLHVETGSIYGLLGKNGAGKTTLIGVLMALPRLDSGIVSVMDCDPLGSDSPDKQRVAYVAQGELLPPGARVAEGAP